MSIISMKKVKSKRYKGDTMRIEHAQDQWVIHTPTTSTTHTEYLTTIVSGNDAIATIKPHKYAIGNARLICYAPELLAACELAATIDTWGQKIDTCLIKEQLRELIALVKGDE